MIFCPSILFFFFRFSCTIYQAVVKLMMKNFSLQACLPLIDDLSNPAMRTRHWKQLVRVTGGALTIDNDTLKRMTLKELLSLGLQRELGREE